MTYCVAVRVDQGLVFVSDSRTNAGIDQLSTYSKMFTFGREGERSFVVLTAGNLGNCYEDNLFDSKFSLLLGWLPGCF